MSKPKFKEPFTYDAKANSLANGTHTDLANPEEDRTIQSFKDSADINVMLERFGVRKVMATPQPMEFYAGEFDSTVDYQTSLHRVMTAQEAFLTVPAELRARFQNDPANLIRYLGDEKNADEARKFGLLKPKVEPPAPLKVEVTNHPQPTTTTPPKANA